MLGRPDWSDPRLAASAARLERMNRARPTYAVTDDDLPQGAAAMVVQGGEQSLRLIVANHTRVADDVLHMARLALACDEMGLDQPDRVNLGTELRVILVLSGERVLMPSPGGGWRQVSMQPESSAEAVPSESKRRRCRLLLATRRAPEELIAGVSLRRSRRNLFW
jgi:hypothetical protein